MTDLEGRSLDEALARAMGWTQNERGFWIDANGEWVNDAWHTLPFWHADLTVLLRDIEPVCRERGEMLGWSVETADKGDRAYFAYVEPIDELSEGFYGPTAATALARAFLAVLTRGER